MKVQQIDLIILQEQKLNILLILLDQDRNFKSTLHANNSFLYANGVKIYHFKTKDSKINVSEIFQTFLQLIT